MTPPTAPSTPTLTTLPTEILSIIISHADRNSVLNLKRVCRALNSLDVYRFLWRVIDLTISPYHGVSPDVQSHAESEDPLGSEPYAVYAQVQGTRNSARHRDGLREKVKALIMAADAEKWRHVKGLTMAPREGSVGPMLLALDYCSSNLQRLVVDGTPYSPFPSFEPERFSFDTTLLDYSLTLPTLSHLHLHYISSCDSAFILKLIASAPSLENLHLDFDPYPLVQASYSAPWRPDGLTKLRSLRCSWGSPEEVEHHAPGVFIGIMDRSPLVRQVTLCFDTERTGVSIWESVLNKVRDHEKLEELRWPDDQMKGDEPGLLGLRTLVARCPCLSTLFSDLPMMPKLEKLYLHGCYDNSPALLSRYEEDPDDIDDTFFFGTTHASFPDFAASLRGHPRLELIHVLPEGIDPAEVDLAAHPEDDPAGLSAYIRSMRRGDEEAISVAFPRRSVEVKDREGTDETPQTASILPDGQSDRNEADRERVYVRSEEVTWLTLTDYKGKAVAEAIMQKVWEEDGGGPEKWQGRGVEVGEKAWAVLEEWYAGLEW